MRGEKHQNARMEISEHGKIVREDFSMGGLVCCTHLEGLQGDRNDVDVGRKDQYGD